MSVDSSIDKNDSERTSFQPDILKSGLGAASYSTQMQLLLRPALHIKLSAPAVRSSDNNGMAPSWENPNIIQQILLNRKEMTIASF
jgi:hypothetical protein